MSLWVDKKSSTTLTLIVLEKPEERFRSKKNPAHYRILIPECFKGVASLPPPLWRWNMSNLLRNNGALTTVWFLISSNSIATQQVEFTKKHYQLCLVLPNKANLFVFMHLVKTTCVFTLLFICPSCSICISRDTTHKHKRGYFFLPRLRQEQIKF